MLILFINIDMYIRVTKRQNKDGGVTGCTPPVGLNMFVAVKISKANLGGMMKHMLPMIACLIVVLLIITYVPWFSLVLQPR